MKKINPKDLEVNPKRVDSNIDGSYHSPERATNVCSYDNYGCTDTETVLTLAVDCTVDTGQSICKCPTVKDCVNTVDGCADTVSKGELCCAPKTVDVNCAGSFRNCESRDYCLETEQDNCTSNDIYECGCKITFYCEPNTANCEDKTGDGCDIVIGTRIDGTCDTL